MSNQTVTTNFSYGGNSGTIPGGAINISMQIAGGRGGTGGSDAGGPGGGYGSGRYGTFSIPTSNSNRSWSGYIGLVGTNGPGGSGAVNGGAGGQNGPISGDGGTGGADGTSGWSGCGAGGGAAGAFYLGGTLVAVAAGGGGGGGGSYSCGGSQNPGGTGGNAGGFSGTSAGIGISNGGGGANKGGGDGGGGGAGGGGSGGGSGGGAGQDCNYGGGGGGGGNSRYRSNLINFISQGGVTGNGYGYLTYQLRIAEITQFSIDDTTIIAGQTTTIRWSVSDSNSQTLDGVGVASSGSQNISPTQSRSYQLLAYGDGGNDSATANITVYQPVVATISASPNPVVAGNNTTLTWAVTGDASGSAFIDNGIGNVLFSSQTSINLSSSTTYTISASGPGGSDTASVAIVVYQIPQITINPPGQILYGDTVTIPVTYRYASFGITITETYTMRDPTGATNGVTVTNTATLPATANDTDSPELSADYVPNVPWGTEGPFQMQFAFNIQGSGGNFVVGSGIMTVEIDTTPETVNIPNSIDELPGEPIVIAPDEEIVISDPIEITDIDIPVEITANRPIQVKFDDDDPDIESSWNNVRESP